MNLRFSLFGNPNCGKTAIFNLLTGLNQKVSNYPGITVEKKLSNVKLDKDISITIEDYPGAYSIIPQSLDEQIVSDTFITSIRNSDSSPDGIIYVADITNLRRSLYFLSQLLILDIPIILLLNMSDLSDDNIIDIQKLKSELGIFNIIPFSALKKTGMRNLKKTLIEMVDSQSIQNNHSLMPLTKEYLSLINPLSLKIKNIFKTTDVISNHIAFSLLCNRQYIGKINFTSNELHEVTSIKTHILDKIDLNMKEHIKTMESDLRYAHIDQLLDSSNYNYKKELESEDFSERIDKVLTHKWFGPIIYVSILYFIFQSIFTWATVPMDFIDGLVGDFGSFIYSIMPDNLFRDFIVDGFIAGIGGIVIFLPQILLLIFFMALLEDTGYMTRITFIMDKFMRKMGLHGKSILPIMSGYACAIPGIISTRTIDSWKERLVTILILPLISCGARLPVYVLMIGAFIPSANIFGFIGLQGFMMVTMYFLGTITAFILAKVFSKFLSESSNPTFIMELPPYRLPIMKSVLNQVYSRGKLFLINAGKIIMAISIIIWLLVSFPKNNLGEVSIDESYAGKIGHLIEPAIEPLGFDWKIGIGLITSFAAREVVVSTLSMIYNVEDEGDDMISLKDAMKNDINPKTGKNVFNPVVAVSLMVFYVYAAQCMATFAVVRTETNSWKWPIFMIVYMTFLAYFMSLLVYQGGKFFGFI